MKLSALAFIASTLLAKVCVAADSSSSMVPRTYSTYEPSAEQIAKDAANATTINWTSDVKGKYFDRFVVIWLENTDFNQAAEQEDMAWVASHGVTLNNYWAVTHPSEPNYISSVGGDYFSLDDDRFIVIPKNVSTVADLLDTKGISFASYQEHLPYTGYQGYNYSNQETFANDYMRKHNPFMSYESYTSNSTRMAVMKNFTEFHKDVANEELPQYVIITPNMTNDAHDSNIQVAGKWTRDFMTPLLSNEYFMNNTLVLITFDENETYAEQNTVFSILLGGVIDESEKGTVDSTFYDHYSQISSLEVNWELPNLGRNDVTANIWSGLADAADLTNKEVDTEFMFNNHTYVGYLLDDTIALPAPNVSATNIAGASILPAISSAWASEYAAQVSASYFTSTTTLSTFAGTAENGASLYAAYESTASASASASGSSSAASTLATKSVGSSSVAASGSSSVSATVSKAGAAQVVPGVSAAIALLFSLLI